MKRFADPVEAFREAVRIAGSQTAFARIVGCTQGNISQLLKFGRLLPPGYVVAVEAATGISRHQLRPDIYPDPPIPAGRTVAGGAPVAQCDRRAKMQMGEPVR